MADAPENLVLELLRDIRAKRDEHDRRFDMLERRLGDLDRKIEDLEYGVNQAVGLASRAVARAAEANTTSHGVERRLEELAARVAALESR